MAEFFKASELLEFAIQIEKNGETYYRAAALRPEEKSIKDMFVYLAGEEVKHRELYGKMLKTAADYEPGELYPEEYFNYLRAYADNHIFVKKEEIERKAAAAKSTKEAIEIAIGFEKDSILYYLEMKNLVSEHDRTVVEKIIDEEHKHYTKLTEIGKTL
jgi:rubrerythrin